MEDKKTTFIVLMLIFSIFLVEAPPMAKADGSISAQEVNAEFTTTVSPPAYDGIGDSLYGIENDFRGAPLDISDLQGGSFDLEMYQATAKIQGISTDGQLMKMAVYEYLAWNDGGALYGASQPIAITDADIFRTFSFSPYASIPSDVSWVFIGCIAQVGSGSVLIHQDTETGAMSITDVDMVYGVFDNPLAGESGGNGTGYLVRGKFYGDKSTTTTFNQYYGNATDYVARRDIDADFPAGVTSREITFTYPKVENMFNITYSNGGSWDLALSPSDYTQSSLNSTHYLIEISEASIASYGDSFRLFTGSYAYIYILKGLFSENGGLEGSVNVTAHSLSDSEEHQVNGTLILCYNEDNPIQFSWSLEGGGSRRIYVRESSENLYVFTPDDTYSSYSFNIRDYTGAIGSGDTFLESLRIVNGTERVIERVLIWDTVNSVPLTLTIGQIYILQVRLPDDSTYRFGYFTPGGDATPTLTIRGIDFEDQAHYVGEHVAVEFSRLNFAHIQIEYQDNLTQTDSVFVEVCYLNTTQVWNDTSTDNPIQFNWYGADNATDYLVNLIAQHDYYGEVRASAWLEGEKPGLTAMPDLSVLGGGFRYGISILVLLLIFTSGSTETRGIITGGTVAMAYVLRYIGWFPAPYVALHLSAFIVVAWILGGTR